MGKKILIGDIFNYIHNTYSIGIIWLLLLSINYFMIILFDYFLKNNSYDCEEIVIDKEFPNIDECNSYFEFYQTKILQSKIILFYICAYHITLAFTILCNNKFFEFYKNNKDVINLINFLIYLLSSFLDKKYIILLNIKPRKFVLFCEIFYLISETISLLLIACFLVIFILYIVSLCYNLYENKIKHIEIYEIPNDPISQLDKAV